jgi:hypothetical protein
MQPCGVCGGTAVDPAGYCTQCRTYRGQPEQQAQPGPYDPSGGASGTPYGSTPYGPAPYAGPGPDAPYGGPSSGPPYSGAPYAGPGGDAPYGGPGSAAPYAGPGGDTPHAGPSSGAPYGGPSSGAPYSGAPYGSVGGGAVYGGGGGSAYGAESGGPGYPPTPTAAYAPAYPPGVPQPAPPTRSRHSFVLPLIALSVVLVIAVAGIVAVVLIRSGNTTPSSPTAGPEASSEAPSAEASALVDACVVGTWKVTSHTEELALDTGKLKFTGSGATVKLNEDGTGVTDYGKGTKFTADMSGVPVTLVVSGTITYDFRTNNNTVSFSNVQADGTLTVNAPGLSTSAPLTGDDKPAKYTCSDNKLTQETELANIEMSKQ